MTNSHATISLRHPAHGLFDGVDPEVLTRAMRAISHRSILLLRAQACGSCGYGDFAPGDPNPLDDCNFLEVLIIWIESGNHTF